MKTEWSRWAGAVLAVLLVLALGLFLIPAHHISLAHVLAGGTVLLFGTTATITAVRAPNQAPPPNSYGANLLIADGDDSPVVIALPTALAARLANYNGVATPATNNQLKFTLTPIVVGAATAGLAVSYNGNTGNLEVKHAKGATTGSTLYVEVAIPTTNNMP
jgi:hypothetical protein